MKRLFILLFGLATLNAAAGCGQSGPLYLPGNPSEVRAPQQEPAQEGASEERTDEKRSDDDQSP